MNFQKMAKGSNLTLILVSLYKRPPPGVGIIVAD